MGRLNATTSARLTSEILRRILTDTELAAKYGLSQPAVSYCSVWLSF